MLLSMHTRSLALTGWLTALLAACGPTPVDPPTGAETGSGASTTDAPNTGPGMTSSFGTSTSGASTSGADTSASSDDTGVDFLVNPDISCVQVGPGGGHSARCTFDCDVVEQDCPEGEKCMPWANDGGNAWNASRCSPIAPDPVLPGGTCTTEQSAVSGVDDCALGSLCWGVDPRTLQGTCVELCDPQRLPSTTCVEPAQCLALNDDYVPVCLTPCDPLQPAPCPDGEACRHVESDGGFHCLPLVGSEVFGSSQHCEDASCLPSQVCVPNDLVIDCDADRCCTELCDLGDPGADAQCAAVDPALGCEAFYRPGAAPAGLELLGACSVPV
jgi:hypothetical protein